MMRKAAICGARIMVEIVSVVFERETTSQPPLFDVINHLQGGHLQYVVYILRMEWLNKSIIYLIRQRVEI